MVTVIHDRHIMLDMEVSHGDIDIITTYNARLKIGNGNS